MECNLFTFGLICDFCPGSQKINILTAQCKRIFNDQGVCDLSRASQPVYGNLWYLKSPLSKEICLLFGQLVISVQSAKKQHLNCNILITNMKAGYTAIADLTTIIKQKRIF